MSSNTRIFVAGASGTIGVPLVRALVGAGYDVTALTRSQDKQAMLRALGARPVVADALDATALRRVVEAARPSHVIHQLTALPKAGASRASDLAPTNRLRREGTRHLLEAAVSAGASRFVVGSFALLQGMAESPNRHVREAVEAVQSMEAQVLSATEEGKIEGVILRYGLFYGAENPATQRMMTMVRRRWMPVIRNDDGLLPCIHLDDAVSATVAAVHRGRPGAIYDIVDDRPVSMSDIIRAMAEATGAPPPRSVPAWLPRVLSPFLASMTTLRLSLANDQARADLGWRPKFATYRDGLADTVSHAA
jgi:nucleoside-diphosphate-sugar epimerase